MIESTRLRPDQATMYFEQAVFEFSAALDADPHSAAALTNRGLAKALLVDFSGARTDAERAGKLDPREPNVYLTLGQIALVEGEATADTNDTGVTEGHYHDAVKQFELAIGLAPHDAAGYWGRARSRFELMQSAVRKHEPAAAGLAKSVLADLERVEHYAGATFPLKERAQLLGMRATARAGIGDYRNALSDYALACSLSRMMPLTCRRGWALIMATNEGMADFDEVLSEEGATDQRILADAHAGQAYLLAVAGNDRRRRSSGGACRPTGSGSLANTFQRGLQLQPRKRYGALELEDETLAEKYALRGSICCVNRWPTA